MFVFLYIQWWCISWFVLSDAYWYMDQIWILWCYEWLFPVVSFRWKQKWGFSIRFVLWIFNSETFHRSRTESLLNEIVVKVNLEWHFEDTENLILWFHSLSIPFILIHYYECIERFINEINCDCSDEMLQLARVANEDEFRSCRNVEDAEVPLWRATSWCPVLRRSTPFIGCASTRRKAFPQRTVNVHQMRQLLKQWKQRGSEKWRILNLQSLLLRRVMDSLRQQRITFLISMQPLPRSSARGCSICNCLAQYSAVKVCTSLVITNHSTW